MTDDLEGLRIVGRELGRGVRPVGFDTLLATSVRRRRRRRRTGAVAAAAVAATAAVTAYLGMPRADRALIPAAPTETVASATSAATTTTSAPGGAVPTTPTASASTAPVSVRADAAIAAAVALRGIWGAGNGMVFEAFASCPTDSCDSAWRVIDASGRMIGRGILTNTGGLNRVIPHATGFVVVDASGWGFTVGSDGVARPLPAPTPAAQGSAPQAGDVLLATSVVPEVYRPSTGQRWELLAASGGHEPVPGGAVWALATMDPTGRLWVPAVGDGKVTIFSSADGGRTYTGTKFTAGSGLGALVSSASTTLAMAQGDTVRIIVGSQTLQAGQQTSQPGPLPRGVELIGMVVTSGGHLVVQVGDYATNRQSLFMSVDTAWSSMRMVQAWPGPTTSVAANLAGSDQVAAAGSTLWTVGSVDTLARSTDHGATWTTVAAR
ncbi:MAG: hypothetical protein IPM08_12005 [Actinomycetales bacterium]|nr:hypothetical protein [Actinomycetales bacterium]